MKFSESGISLLRLIQLEKAEKMKIINNEERALIKQVLNVKLNRSTEEQAKEVPVDPSNNRVLIANGITAQKIREIIKNEPITDTYLTKRTRHVFIETRIGRKQISIEVLMFPDQSGVDVLIKHIEIKY